MKTQFVLAILAFLALSTPARSQQIRICSRDLSEALVKYCPFSTMGKRSDSWIRTQLFGAGYWLTPQLAVGMGRGKRQRGIATECCENTCSFKKLLEYCPE